MADQYRLTRKRLTRSSGEEFVEGDVFEPTEAELRAFDDRVEKVEDDAEEDEDEADVDDAGDDESDNSGEQTGVEEHSDAVDESEGADEGDDTDERAVELANANYQTAVATVESGDADDYLDSLEQVDDRKSVQGAIADRREELADA